MNHFEEKVETVNYFPEFELSPRIQMRFQSLRIPCSKKVFIPHIFYKRIIEDHNTKVMELIDTKIINVINAMVIQC